MSRQVINTVRLDFSHTTDSGFFGLGFSISDSNNESEETIVQCEHGGPESFDMCVDYVLARLKDTLKRCYKDNEWVMPAHFDKMKGENEDEDEEN